MPGLMQGKRGLVMGVANDHSIAWGIAKALADNGAQIAFTYQGEALGRRVKPLAESIGSKIILPCDVEDIASVDGVFAELIGGDGLGLIGCGSRDGDLRIGDHCFVGIGNRTDYASGLNLGEGGGDRERGDGEELRGFHFYLP